MSRATKIVLTPLAQALAARLASVETIAGQAQAELQELLQDGLEAPEELMFHAFGPDDAFVMTPESPCTAGSAMIVDATVWEELGQELDGKPISIATPAGAE